MGDFIYIVGSLGYSHATISETPIFRLDVRTFQIERMRATGNSPGWIHRHRVNLTPSHQIVVSGGKIVTIVSDEQVHSDNPQTFILDLTRMEWRLANAEDR